jgi:hypothetical protein
MREPWMDVKSCQRAKSAVGATKLFYWLCSDKASFVMGHALVVGGRIAGSKNIHRNEFG